MMVSGLKYIRFVLGLATFIFYGCGGIFCGWCLFPLIRLFSASSRQSVLRVRFVIHCLFRYLVVWLRFIGILKLNVTNHEVLQQPEGQLLLANHPTFLDVVLLISLLPNANCLVKSQLRKNIFFSSIVHYAGYIHNDALDDMLEQCSESLRNGDCLIVFPEGTRTTPGEPLKFLRGAANIAIRCQASIRLVTLWCDPLVFTKRDRWYSVVPRTVQFNIFVNPVTFANDVLSNDQPLSMAARQLTQQLQHYFTQELIQHGQLRVRS